MAVCAIITIAGVAHRVCARRKDADVDGSIAVRQMHELRLYRLGYAELSYHLRITEQSKPSSLFWFPHSDIDLETFGCKGQLTYRHPVFRTSF